MVAQHFDNIWIYYKDVTQKYNIPVLYNFPAGHIQDNRALIMGSKVTIDVNATCSKVVFE